MKNTFQEVSELSGQGDCEVTFFTSITHMELPENLSRKGFQIVEGIYLISDSNVVNELVSSSTAESIGRIETNFIVQNSQIALSNWKEIPMLDADTTCALIFQWLTEISVFNLGLWLVKDNSVNFDLGFAVFKPKHKKQVAHSNSVVVRYVNAAGEREKTNWTHEELHEARRFHGQLTEILEPQVSRDSLKLRDVEKLHSKLVKGSPRTQRFFYILSGSRSEDDLGLRVAEVVQAMEILFSTTKGELTYRLCLRIALLIGVSADEQRQIFKIMKDSYSVRSTIVHGAPLQPNIMHTLPALSKDLESLVRQIGRRLLTDSSFNRLFDLRDDALEAIFSNFVFDREFLETAKIHE